MNVFILVAAGNEELAVTEISELVGVKGKVLGSGVVVGDIDEKKLVSLVKYGQSFRRIMVGLDSNKSVEKLGVNGFKVKDYFSSSFNFVIEVEGVKGQENRVEISKVIGSKVFDLDNQLKIDYKKPDVTFLVYFDGKKYYLGVDGVGFALDKRKYRVFPHQSSVRGDFAYSLVRKTGFVTGEKIVVGFVKDGTIAIEAALFNFGKVVHKNGFAFDRFPLFAKVKKESRKVVGKGKVYAFDDSMMNMRAAKKNAVLAGVASELVLGKYGLDELDVKFKEGELDRLLFQVTRKDEDTLNEMYYQASYVLRKKGILLIMGRGGWEITISDKFKLVSEEVVRKGDSGWKVWVLEKK